MSYTAIERAPYQEDKVFDRWLYILAGLQNKVKVYSESVDAGTVGANTTAEIDVSISGIRSTDIVIAVNKPTHSAGLGVSNYRVKADDTVSIQFINTTGVGISPGAETYAIIVLEQ